MASNSRPFRLTHQLLRRGGKIRSRRFSPDGYEHYKLRLHLEGDLDAVERVEYELHPTFRNPHRVVDDPSDGFAIDIWTWGEFSIAVTIHLKDGTKEQLTHDLAYSDELPDDDAAYTAEGPSR